jgi:hypothetical protein
MVAAADSAIPDGVSLAERSTDASLYRPLVVSHLVSVTDAVTDIRTFILCFVFGGGFFVLDSPGDLPEEAFAGDLPLVRALDRAVVVLPAS